MSQLITQLNSVSKAIEPYDALKLFLVIKAWEKLSFSIEEEDYSFENFFSKKVTVDNLSYIFEELSKDIRVFSLYHFDLKKLDDETLASIVSLARNTIKLPNINDLFFDNKNRRGQMFVPNQIAELGIKLLHDQNSELYVPFSDTFAYAQFANSKVYSDCLNVNCLLIAELINILENKKITLEITNSLEEPAFLDNNAPHILKQFDYILSFPAFGLQDKFDIKKDRFHRYKFQQGSQLDIAQIEHILAQLNHKAVVLMHVGFTYRGGGNERFREYLIENNLIEAIIQLPPNIFSTTSIETTFIVLNKQKMNNDIFFINLKSENFIKRDGRQLVFKSVNEIVDLYKSNEIIENISAFVNTEEIKAHNFSLAIDRYVDTKNAQMVEKQLSQVVCTKLENFAQIIRSQLIQDEGQGKEIIEISPADFQKAGFTLVGSKIKQIGSQSSKLNVYRLNSYDVLLGTKGNVGKVGIIGDINRDMVASQAIQVIRIKECENKKEMAIALYMYLKSDLGQALLSTLITGAAMPQIMLSEIKKLRIPELISNMTPQYKKMIVERFNQEDEYYAHIKAYENKIDKLNTDFLRLEI